MSDRIFAVEEIRRFAQEVTAREEARASRVRTDAGRALIAASRTVLTKDGGVITVVDGDILDAIVAIESAVSDEGGQS